MENSRTYRIDRSTILVLLLAIVVLFTTTTTSSGHPPPIGGWNHGGVATWYGPGYYGHTFACPGAGTYTKGTRGVAVNSSFANCGARFTLRYHGQTIHVRVIDRCPGCASSWRGPGTHPFDLTAKSTGDLCKCSRPYTLNGVTWKRTR